MYLKIIVIFYQKYEHIFQPLQNEHQTVANRFMKN